MRVDVTPAIATLLANNRGPDPDDPGRRVPPDYGVRATLDGARLEIELTFRAGAAYCCMEIGCHFRLTREVAWRKLRDALGKLGSAPPMPLEAHVAVIIEPGARFFDLFDPDRSRPGWYAFRASDGQRYEVESREADAVAH